MSKTVLITGASTGIGKSTAILFQQKGWNVAATMRAPEKATDLSKLTNILCIRLDVTEPSSIRQAIEETILRFGSIDVLLNNAGYAAVGAFEASKPEQIKRQFDTNVFGLMEVTRAILPHFRGQGSGTIINVASVGGRMAFPLYSLYNSTKWAVEGFSESLQYELRPLNIKIKIIEPGPIKTDFYTRSMDIMKTQDIDVYDDFVEKAISSMNEPVMKMGSPPEKTAKVIYKAATDSCWRLRYPAGGNAAPMLFLRKLLPDSILNLVIRIVATH